MDWIEAVLPEAAAGAPGVEVDAADRLEPRWNREWLEYAQASGLAVDPARVRSPQDKGRVEAGHDIQHVGPARRAEVLLPRLEVAGGIVFEIRVITAQAVLANVV